MNNIKTTSVFALVDCNNFFVSCARVFRPDLIDKPVVSLSSNDGCVVARSNEAKALGIPMGAPAFKWKQFFANNNVVQLSGNFELYGDFSKRITSILTSVTPKIEIYSVDESFLDLSELNIKDYSSWGREVRSKIMQWTGIPVSIGIAPSKTLAKLATERSKKDPKLDGVLDLTRIEQYWRSELEKVSVADVWGVGRRLAPKLKAEGIHNAYELANLRPQYAQALMGVHGRQMVMELNGTSCLPILGKNKLAKSISSSRTFGQDTNQLHILESAIATFTAKASQGLRSSEQLAGKIGFFIATNPHKPGYKLISRQIELSYPSADTGYLSEILIQKLAEVFNKNHYYHRAGVWLNDFISEDSLQIDILGKVNVVEHDNSSRRMEALDTINSRFGKHTLYFATEELDKSWQPLHQNQLPRWTTQWDELPTAKLI